MPESTAHDAVLDRICSLLRAWAARMANGARVSRNLAVRWLPDYPRTGIDPDVAVLLPGPADFDELASYRLWEPGRPPPVFAVEVVSAGHPYKDYSWVHEGYAEMGALELLVVDPLLLGPRSLGGPVPLQLWRRDIAGAFERVHFGETPVYSEVLDAWVLVQSRKVILSEDRAGTRAWPTLEEAAAERAAAQAKAEAAQSKAEAAQSRTEAAQSKAEAERERRARLELEERLRELETKSSS